MMRAAKKLEIVVDAIHAPEVLKVLTDAGVSGYTVVRNAAGMGNRGERFGDELTDVFTNWAIMTACEPAMVEGLVQKLRPILRKHGGVCLVSDCEWLDH